MTKIIKSRKVIFTSIVALLFISYACSDTVDVITYDSPEFTFEGERELLVSVNSSDGQALTGYDIVIDGPTSSSQSGVSQSTFTFTDLATGEYTITASRDGYVSSSINLEINLPSDDTESYYNEAELFMRERTPSVMVNNNAESVIETAPSDAEGEEGQNISLTFPAGTFPQNAVDGDGNISISVTRSVPSQIDNEYNEGTTQDILDFEPADLELNEEVEIDIPVSISDQLVASLGISSPNSGSDNGISFVLQPGNIPVELVEENSKSAKVVTDSSIETQGFNRRFKARAKISRFQQYRLVPNIRITRSVGISDPQVIARSGCGLDVTVNHSFQTGMLSPVISRYVKMKKNRTVTRSASYNGAPGVRLTVSAQHETVTYTARRANGSVIESSTINHPPVTFTVTSRNCHDSGGG